MPPEPVHKKTHLSRDELIEKTDVDNAVNAGLRELGHAPCNIHRVEN